MHCVPHTHHIHLAHSLTHYPIHIQIARNHIIVIFIHCVDQFGGEPSIHPTIIHLYMYIVHVEAAMQFNRAYGVPIPVVHHEINTISLIFT